MQDRSENRRRPNFLSWAVSILLVLVAAILIWPYNTGEKHRVASSMCLSHLKHLALGNLMYADENNERFPDRDAWMDAITPFVKEPNAFRCPTFFKEKNPSLFGYAFHGRLSLSPIPENPEDVPLVFESENLARNASGTLASLPKPARHKNASGHRNMVSYADGLARAVK